LYWKLKSSRHDACDGKLLAAERNALANNVRVRAETFLP